MGLAGSIGAHVDTASAGAVTLVTVDSRDPGVDLATKGEQAADIGGPGVFWPDARRSSTLEWSVRRHVGNHTRHLDGVTPRIAWAPRSAP